MTIAQLSKVKLDYVQHGHGPGRVLLVHGFQASARIWHGVQEALPADRYTSIALNNRGAGASDAPADEADYGVEIFAADAFELVTKLGWTRFTLVGHSLGGATAMSFALDHPQLLSGLILLDPANPDGRALAPDGPGIDAIIDRAMAARRKALAEGAVGDGIGATDVEAAPLPWLRQLAEDMRNAPEQRLRGSMRSMFNIRIGDRLKDLPMPVLLAAGDRDELIPLADMLATWTRLPAGSGLHVWHGVGHSPNVDCPAELAGLIRRFVETTGKRA
jgi:pimeloyl-ACP methyl ester carboxylesterase